MGRLGLTFGFFRKVAPPMTSTPENCQDLLARMIEFDTVVAYQSGRSAPEIELAGYLANLARQWGLGVRELPIDGACHNVLVECPGEETAPWLLFDSHLDTVGIEGMTIPPFSPTVRDGRIHGRGACDTKGTGAAMLWAMRQYARRPDRHANVALLFSVGEEHIQTGARAFVDEHLPQLGWRPSAVVVGEPTRMKVLAATGGFIRWKMTTHGQACHSSRPERGHNAIYDMARLISIIEQQYIDQIAGEDPLMGRASAAITVIAGGQQVNVIPSQCTMVFDRRLIPGEQADRELEKVQRIVDEVTQQRPGMKVTHHQFESAPPMAKVDHGRWAETAVQAIKRCGIPSDVGGELFTTNGNHFAAAGIPTIVTGPGDIAQAHTPDEWLELEQLELGVEAYASLMDCNVPAHGDQ